MQRRLLYFCPYRFELGHSSTSIARMISKTEWWRDGEDNWEGSKNLVISGSPNIDASLFGSFGELLIENLHGRWPISGHDVNCFSWNYCLYHDSKSTTQRIETCWWSKFTEIPAISTNLAVVEAKVTILIFAVAFRTVSELKRIGNKIWRILSSRNSYSSSEEGASAYSKRMSCFKYK